MDEETAWGKARQTPSRLRAVCAEALEKGKLWTCEEAGRNECGLSSKPVKEDQGEMGRWPGHARLSRDGGFLIKPVKGFMQKTNMFMIYCCVKNAVGGWQAEIKTRRQLDCWGSPGQR